MVQALMTSRLKIEETSGGRLVMTCFRRGGERKVEAREEKNTRRPSLSILI